MTHLLTVLALDAGPVLWLWTILTNVTDGITVAADINLLVGALVLAMTGLTTVEAGNLRLCRKLVGMRDLRMLEYLLVGQFEATVRKNMIRYLY